MSIAKTEIKLMGSERLTDYDDGGGEMTGSEIVDGELNNLFPDISRLDRVYGRVSLRKAFAAVMTENTDMYYGSHAIITDPPEDDNVHVTLFTTEDNYDERLDAKDRIESYVTIGGQLSLRPLNDQLEGQRQIVCFQSVGGNLPDVGDTIVLYNTAAGSQQYVKISDISSERTEFVHVNYGKFTVDVVTISLTSALQYTFPGLSATPYTTVAATVIHATVVADASSYYGVSMLSEAASSGSRTLTIDSIYNQLVPTSDIETAFVDQLMGGANVTMVAIGVADSLLFSGNRSDAVAVIHLSTGVLPGSLSLTLAGYAFIDSRGSLVAVDSDGGYGGSIDYTSGQITLTGPSEWSVEVSLSATPAVGVSESWVSREIEIELANRAYNYTPNLSDPLPSPGSISIAYMAQGKWYELYDNGKGVIVGREDGTGTGTVNYASGSMILTLGALPDVGSTIILLWGHGLETEDRSGAIDSEPFEIRHSLPHQGIELGSITLTWDDDGVAKTATDDGSGAITGDATGSVSYGSGEILFTPTTIPASGTEYAVSYRQEAPADGVVTSLSMAGEYVTLSIPNAPIRPGSVSFSWTVDQIKKAYADGTVDWGSVSLSAQDNGSGTIVRNGSPVGSINYTTGECTFQAIWSYSYKTYTTLKPNGITYYNYMTTETETLQSPPGQVNVVYAEDVVASYSDQTDSIATADLKIDLCPQTVDTLVAGSVRFAFGGHNYYDDGTGNLYRDRDEETGVGTLAGTINYASGLATLTSYPAATTATVTLTSLLTKDGGFTPVSFVFRTSGSPLRDGSLSLRTALPDGTSISAVAATSGVISDTLVDGLVDSINGVVRIKFGELVVAAGNEEEDWYAADAVDDDGNIWKPSGVVPESSFYNCVVYTSLPLDADLIGIEPIRLPSDGRVPIFKSGMVAVVHHTNDELLDNPIVADTIYNLEREKLALCDIRDQAGALVDEANYTLDLTAGTITFPAPLDLSAYTQPLVAATRIEDMVLISEAQINGYLSTVGPLTHDFPANETQVSSALIFGDLAGRIVRTFTQKTWDSIWADSRSGDDTTAKYDDKNYPFTLTNNGSIAQRWVIKFTSATEFDVIGENLGVVASGTTNSNCAPLNPATDVPYFSIDYRGWGTGWATGNCLRFDTSAANAPLWIARTTMQGAVEELTDEFVLQIRGDAN